MTDSRAKYHHLIPRTYMSAWNYSGDSLYVEFIDYSNGQKSTPSSHNINNIAGANHFYAITAGMPIVTIDEAQKIFDPLTDYTVMIDGQLVSDPMVMNGEYFRFDEWEIFDANGSLANKKRLKAEIDKIRLTDIETLWGSKYENNWDSVRREIEQNILQTNKGSVPEFEKEYLMKFFLMLDWRSALSNSDFDNYLKKIGGDILKLDQVDIPKEERERPYLMNIYEELRHDLLLKYYRDFLNDTGIIYTRALNMVKYASLCFMVASGTDQFITSDNPAFIHSQKDGMQIGLMPISPRILLACGKTGGPHDLYYINSLTNNEVQTYNEIVRMHAGEFVILNH